MLVRKGVYLNRVLRSQWLSPKKINDFQMEAVREILLHAKKTVPFYKEKLKGFDVLKIKKQSDLANLPTISRKEFLDEGINAYSSEFQYAKKEDLRQRATSGSTGSAFTIKYDERAYDYLEAIYARAFFSQKYNPFFPMAYYWYELLETKIHNRFGLFRRQYISCSWTIGRQIAELIRLNPRYIHYFSSAIYYIARVIRPEDAKKIRPKVVFCHAEILSEKMRARIEKVFKTKVLDMYGTTEFVRMAWECPECRAYHVEDDSILLEILDENNKPCGPGKRGRFVVTGLANYLLPLIRYEMGDYGCWSTKKSKCGRGLRLIEGVEGREDDFLIARNGDKISPKKVIDCLDRVDELAIFKVIQTGENKFVIKCKPKKGIILPKQKVIGELKKLVGEDTSVLIKEELPEFSKRGKLRMVQRCL